MTEQVTLKFEVPGKDAPGYLRRMRQALEFQQALGNPSPETLDKLVEYLAQYVTDPKEHDDKIEALWMASQDEFVLLLNELTGGDENPTE